MRTIRYLLISTIALALLLGHEASLKPVQASPILVKSNDVTVQEGAKVTVWFQITPRDSPTTTYSNIEQFVQGQHTIPLELEQRIAGMHPGEVATVPLSAEEGFGPYDETKIQTIPPAELPLEAREGDTIATRRHHCQDCQDLTRKGRARSQSSSGRQAALGLATDRDH